MTPQIDHVRIFVASPGDVGEERKRLGALCQKLAPGFLKRGVGVTLLAWETHTSSATGASSQGVINEQIGHYEVFLGMMWKRFGQPTGKAGSGTEEEFNIAYERRKAKKENSLWPRVSFFFRTSGPLPTTTREVEEYAKVVAFRERIGEQGVYHQSYESVEDFADKVAALLDDVVNDVGKHRVAASVSSDPVHPPGTRGYRKETKACRFRIFDEYDKTRNWNELGDVRVEIQDHEVGGHVFLIPGMKAPLRIRDGAKLRNDGKALALKKKATEAFVKKKLDDPLQGVWFEQDARKGTAKRPKSVKVYCDAYDEFLTDFVKKNME